MTPDELDTVLAACERGDASEQACRRGIIVEAFRSLKSELYAVRARLAALEQLKTHPWFAQLFEATDEQPKTPPTTAGRGEAIYPCADCGVLRTKAEGGTTFTVCDECWGKHYGKPPPQAQCETCRGSGEWRHPALDDMGPLECPDCGGTGQAGKNAT
jgi:hypothetical protein